MNKFSLSALAVAGLLVGGLTAGSASAADLGGNCCADLEERIAELEATTARKGNRKVSLTISGWVAEQVMYWDDGVEDNVYVVGLGSTLASHFKMTGQAQISPGWSAGYVLHAEVDGSDSLTISQDVSDGPGAFAGTARFAQAVQSYWFLQSDHLGKVSVGLQSQASDNTAILVDGSGSLVPANWVLFNVNSFRTRFSSTGALGPNFNFFGGCHRMGGAAGDCNGLTQNAVRYDSPTWAGFSVSASWGADDFWDVAVRYSGEHHGFKIAVAAAYNETNDPGLGATSGIDVTATFLETPFFGIAQNSVDLDYFQIGGYVQHVATGLWVYGAYGRLDTDDNNANGFIPDRTQQETWYVKAGLRERWHPLGHTVIYGEYMQTDTDNNRTDVVGIDIGILDYIPSPALLNVNATSANNSCTGNITIGSLAGSSASGHCVTGANTRLTMWGLGVVQEIDAAAMSMWLKYRNFDPEINGIPEFLCGGDAVNGLQGCELENFQEVTFGALINF